MRSRYSCVSGPGGKYLHDISFSGETPPLDPRPYTRLCLYTYVLCTYTILHRRTMIALTGTTRPFLFRRIFVFSRRHHPCSLVLCACGAKFNFVKCTPEVDRDDCVNMMLYAMGTVNTNQPHTYYNMPIHIARVPDCRC